MKNEKHNGKIATFWNDKDEPTRKEIAKALSGYLNVPVSSFLVEVDFDGLPVLQKNILKNYFEQYILPQKGQQIRFDGIIHEKLPSGLKCPRCEAPVIQTISKRGVHLKCLSCQYDSNQVFDFDKNRRRGHVRDCMRLLKEMFPRFNIIENMPYSPNILFSGEIRAGTIKYDCKVFWMKWTLARIRVELNQHLTRKQFYDAEECYIIGRRDVVDYLDKKDAIIVHYLVDEKESSRILMSRAKDIIKHNIIKEDKFKNLQYFIPKESRKDIIKSSKKDMQRMITADFFELLYKNIGVF